MATSFRWSAVTVDCTDPIALAGFWQSLLGGDVVESLPGWRRIVGGGGVPWLTFAPVPEPKVGKNRLHLDLVVDDLTEAVATITELGGSATGEQHRYDEGVVTVMTDIEGNEFCVVAYTACGGTPRSMSAQLDGRPSAGGHPRHQRDQPQDHEQTQPRPDPGESPVEHQRQPDHRQEADERAGHRGGA